MSETGTRTSQDLPGTGRSPAESTTYLRIRPPAAADARDTSAAVDGAAGGDAGGPDGSDAPTRAEGSPAGVEGAAGRTGTARPGLRPGEDGSGPVPGRTAVDESEPAGTASTTAAGESAPVEAEGGAGTGTTGPTAAAEGAPAQAESAGTGTAGSASSDGRSVPRGSAAPDSGPSTAVLEPPAPAPATIPALPLAPRDPTDRPFAHPRRSVPGKPDTLLRRLFGRK